VAGGWGVITKSDNMYNISCKIVGEGIALTYFYGKSEVWYWDTNTGNDTISIKEIYLQYVHIIKYTYGATFSVTCGGFVERSTFEYSQILSLAGRSGNELTISHCSFLKIQNIRLYSYTIINNIQNIGSVYGFNINDSSSNINIIAASSNYAVYTYILTDGSIFRKLKTIDCTNAIAIRTRNGCTRNFYFIDCDMDYNTYGVIGAATGIDIIHGQSTFRYYFGDGVHLLLLDQFGNTVLDIDINDADSDVITFYKHTYEYLTGTGVIQDVEIDYFPFTACISKAGYQTLEIPNITINGGEETVLVGELVREELFISAVDITDCTSIGASDGELEITAEGGDGTYEYSLDGVTYQAGNTFSGLAPDDYTVYVKDGEDTVASFDVTVSDGESEILVTTDGSVVVKVDKQVAIKL